jgi:hypothetical protein
MNNYSLRIGVGHESVQSHTFQCVSCHEDITLRLHVDNTDVFVKFENIDNCQDGTKEGTIYNLHPEYVFSEDQLHVDQAFPWLEDIAQIAHKQMEMAEAQGLTIDNVKMLEAMQGTTSTEDLWKVMKKAWSLEKNGRTDLSLETLKGYVDFSFSEEQNFEQTLFHFCGRFIGPRGLSIFSSTGELFKKAKNANEAEYTRFIGYYLENFREGNFANYLDIFTEFFRDFSEYNQVLSRVQYELDIGDDIVAGSSSFKRTKMFYGNAFEVYTSSLSVLACINNINKGRKFDEFQSMDLAKYLTINKAKRADPFKDIPDLQPYVDCVESTLRNASHHKSIKLRGKKVHYRSGGTGAERSMSYAEYLTKCTNIFVCLCCLVKLELAITHGST